MRSISIYLCDTIYFTASLPFQRRECCSNPDLSVLIAGDIEGLSFHFIDEWIKSKTELPFEHVMKRHSNGFGHIHFATKADASAFYDVMKGFIDIADAPDGRTNVRICPAKDRMGRLSNYETPRQPKRPRVEEPETETEAEPKYETEIEAETKTKTRTKIKMETETKAKAKPVADTASNVQYDYDLREEAGSYIISVHTPGISQKAQLDVEVEEDQTIYIIAENSNVKEGYIVQGLPRRFEVKVTLPNKILVGEPVKIAIENGETTLKLKYQEKKIKMIIS